MHTFLHSVQRLLSNLNIIIKQWERWRQARSLSDVHFNRNGYSFFWNFSKKTETIFCFNLPLLVVTCNSFSLVSWLLEFWLFENECYYYLVITCHNFFQNIKNTCYNLCQIPTVYYYFNNFLHVRKFSEWNLKILIIWKILSIWKLLKFSRG